MKLISYTESTFKENKIDILTKTMVKEIKPGSVVVQKEDKSLVELPCGVVVWAGVRRHPIHSSSCLADAFGVMQGNKARSITVDLMKALGAPQAGKRGLAVDPHLAVAGAEGSIWALGDCSSTSYAPTAQVASQQGSYLARQFAQMARKDGLERDLQVLRAAGGEDAAKVEGALARMQTFAPFSYSHQGSLAYIGSDKAIADLPIFGQGNVRVLALGTMQC